VFGFAYVNEPVETEAWLCVCVCGYEGAGAMCRPSLLPGGVSSAAETSADADCDADCEAVIDSFRLGAYPLFWALVECWVGEKMACEVLLVTELADADIELFCPCRVLLGRMGFIVRGVDIDEELVNSSPVGLGGTLPLSSFCSALFLVAAPRLGSKLALPCNCSTSSSHLTLSVDDGRSARSARLRQSFVRSCKLTHIWWKRKRSPSVV
jgi:hypothetical protein